eukprot:3773974-Rhodomonas_salina.1
MMCTDVSMSLQKKSSLNVVCASTGAVPSVCAMFADVDNFLGFEVELAAALFRWHELDEEPVLKGETGEHEHDAEDDIDVVDVVHVAR